MAVKVPGSMAGLQMVKEDEYGVTPQKEFFYGGRMRTLDGTFNPNPEELEPDNSREFDDVIFTNEDHGFETELSIFRDSGGYSWTDLMALALGSLAVPVPDLPTFSSLMQVARDQFFLARGGMVSSLELSTEGVGKQIRANVSVTNMRIMVPTNTRPSVGADASQPDSAPLTYNAYPTTTITGASKVQAKSWSITINNNLTPQEGFDTDGVPLSAGSGIVPGKKEIGLTMEIMSTSLFWDALKMNRTKDFDVTFAIDGYDVRLMGCYLPAGDMPSRSNMDTYDETITVKARSMTITKGADNEAEL